MLPAAAFVVKCCSSKIYSTHCTLPVRTILGSLQRAVSVSAVCFCSNELPLQEPYAEWVGVRARVALLEANAICAVHLLSTPDKAVTGVVSKAHRLHAKYA